MKINTLNENSLNFLYSLDSWNDWKWQSRNAYRDEPSLRAACNDYGDEIANNIKKNLASRKMQVTPYYLKLVMDSIEDNDISKHPLWRQVVPYWNNEGLDGYDADTENWELDHEMKTPICQHKYKNRVILRTINTCNAYCQFCFEALRTLQVETKKKNNTRQAFSDSINYIKTNKEIEEVIFSGGDPLVLSDKKFGYMLSEVRGISKDILIRVHTRALSFNPYRITDQFIENLKKYNVNSFGVHVCHPLEITNEFKDAVEKINKVVPIVFSNMPLLKGINDDYKTLHKLFMSLYSIGVKPYYLYHFMPFSPGKNEYKISVNSAIKIMNKLKRNISNIAMPEYVLPHIKGKYTVPLIDTPENIPYFHKEKEKVLYKFKNWKGEECSWEN